MAESLASYFEKNSLNSVVFGIAGNQDSSATISRASPTSWTYSYGNKLDITREGCFPEAVAREPVYVLGDNTQYQMHMQEQNGGLIDSICAPPYTKKLNEKGPTNSLLEHRMKEVESGDSPSSSSFEFHVSLEEGISLSVDLNFNPSDCINSMRDEVNVRDSMRRRKSSHSDVGSNNATECKKQKSSVHVQRESCISPEMEDSTQLPSDHHSSDELSLASSATEPCSRIKEGSDSCKEEKGLNLSIPDSSGPVQIAPSCLESYSKSCCVNTADLDCVNTASDLFTKIPGNQSMESFQKVGNSSTVVICPLGAGSELSSSSDGEAYQSNSTFSPRKISRSSAISSSELIIDREFTSYSESFKFRYNEGKNFLPQNTEEQEKNEVLSEQAWSG